LSVIESNLRAGIVSSAGAVGPWQLMSVQAKRFGLKLNKKVDERKSFSKSTQVAATLLRTLYNEFGNWLLVIAAYNAGEGRVKQAIRKSGSKDFWNLQSYLPAETRAHVKKFIATHYFFEGSGGLTTMTNGEMQDYHAALAANNALYNINKEAPNTSVIEVEGKYSSLVTSKILLMDILEFNRLNPGFDKLLDEGQVYKLRLPDNKLSLFKDKKQQILKESVELLFAAPAEIAMEK
jgi:membrane-bound lytic murein transglycosylase D